MKAEALFSAKGISEADRQPMLDSIVDDNEEQSLSRAKKLIEAIEKATDEKIRAAMRDVKTPGAGSGAPNTPAPTESIGKILGKQVSAAKKAGEKAIAYYTIGGNQ